MNGYTRPSSAEDSPMRIWFAASFILLLAPLAAHATVTAAGSNCAQLPAGTASLSVDYTVPVTAPAGAIATIVISQNAPLGTVTDNKANSYPGSITRFFNNG